MTRVSQTVSQRQFDNHLQNLDANKDGKIDIHDAKLLEKQSAEARAAGVGSMFIPLAGFFMAPSQFAKADELQNKAKQIHDLISKQNDGVLDSNDIRKPSARSYRPTCERSRTSLHPQALPPRFVEGFNRECQELSQTLQSAKTHPQKMDALDQIAKFFEKLLEVFSKFFGSVIPFADIFKALQPPQASEQGASPEASSASPTPLVAHQGSPATPTTSTASACSTTVSSSSASSIAPRPFLSGSEGLKQDIIHEWKQSGSEIQDLREKIRNCKNNDEKQLLMLDLQDKINQQARLFELLNKIQKQSHDTQMSIIRNIG